MKKFSLAVLLACSGAGYAQDACSGNYTQGIDKWSTSSTIGPIYRAISCVSSNPNPGCGPLEVSKLEPNVWVTIYITPATGSGCHSHEPAAPRPNPVTIYPAARIQTGADGIAHWRVVNNGWAGLYNVVMIGEDKQGPTGILHFPTERSQYYLSETVPDANGILHFYSKLRAFGYAATPPDDTRHKDIAGNIGYNMWGTASTTKAFQTAAERYLVAVVNIHARRLAPWRLSLPVGGNVDNETDINKNYLFPLENWTVRKFEAHAYGVSIDTANPRFQANQSDDLDQLNEWNRAYLVLYKVGFRLNIHRPDGSQIPAQPGQDYEQTVLRYWYNQPIVHWVNSKEPIALLGQ